MKILKIHRNYLLNKINITVILFLEIVALMIGFFSISSINKDYSWFNREFALTSYLENSLLYFKLIIVTMCCYLWGSSFTKEKDSYHLLINNYHRIKYKYLVTKLLILAIVSFFIIYFMCLIFSVIGILCSNWYEIDKKMIVLYLSYLLIVIIYGLLSVIFSLIIPSEFAYFISAAVFVFGEIIKDSVQNFGIIKIFQLFFPTIGESEELATYYGFWHLLILILMYTLVIILICLKNKIEKK